MREFASGATRDGDDTKPDYEGFLSPEVLKRFGVYMTEHRVQADGKLRASDNWQRGIPRDVYLKSQLRHTIDQWHLHRDGVPLGERKHLEDACCAILFNVAGYLYELLKGR